MRINGIKLIACIVVLFTVMNGYSQDEISIDHFERVIVSPHIEVVFKKGNKESLQIINAKVPKDKINLEVEKKRLWIYLDGAKIIEDEEDYDLTKWEKKKSSIYSGTVLTAIVTYKTLNEISVRGEETFKCEGSINAETFKLKLFGSPKVIVNDINVKTLRVAMYGEAVLEIKDGMVDEQKYAVYGEVEIDTLGLENDTTKIAVYGDGNFKVNVSESLKVTAFGDASVVYNGNPSINKGIILGDATIRKMN